MATLTRLGLQPVVAVAGTPGSISGLASPASASYDSGDGTFVWQSNSNTPANMDAGSYIFRNDTVNSNGITVEAPAALGSNYTLTLPAIPSQTNVMTLDTSGNMGSITYNQVGQAMTSVGADAIAESVTRSTGTTVGLLGVAKSTSCGNFTTNSHAFITNLTVTITTSGRPVMLRLQSDGVTDPGGLSIACQATVSGGQFVSGGINFVRNSANISYDYFGPAQGIGYMGVNPSSFSFVDIVGAGTYTYNVNATIGTSGSSPVFFAQDIVLVAYEL